jgi:hypothetical protein
VGNRSNFNLLSHFNSNLLLKKILFSGMSKLLVGLGRIKERTDTFEIVDLDSASTTCSNLPNFPQELQGSFGGIGFHDQPIICGGTDSNWTFSNKCFSLEGNKWTPSPSLNIARVWAAASPSPYPSKSQKLFVTGGTDETRDGLNTTEVLTEQGWKTLEQKLPALIEDHCSVLVNATTVLIIGGMQNDSVPTNTYYFNTENEIWTEGPSFKNRRFSHSCGKIRTNNQSQEFSIIIAGGYDGAPYLSSVEILDSGSKEWRKGPELPLGITDAQMVEDQNGGVVLVGGSYYYNSTTSYYLDTLYQLPHAGPTAEWTKMKQKLKKGRSSHVAFMVPDTVAKCA